MGLDNRFVFCATGKTGLGHLRRVTNIATALRGLRPEVSVDLLTNASRGGLTAEEEALYRCLVERPREAMVEHLGTEGAGAVVVDTAVLPGLHRLASPLCLVLRETVTAKLDRFRLDAGRQWDLVLVPNPASCWLPDCDRVGARRVEATGWIYREARVGHAAARNDGGRATVLIASGGGGNSATATAFRTRVGGLLQAVRERLGDAIEVVQALGPRAPEELRIPGVDRIVHPGARLHEEFPAHDLIISTAGYNSVLELARCDVPTLLLSVERTYDDQEKRTREWGEALGLQHRDDEPGRSVAWMVRVLAGRQRRAPVELGESGAARAAQLIADLLP